LKIKELTYSESNNDLNNLIKIFQALTLNCEVGEESPYFDILSQICYDLRPKILIHSYTFPELITILKTMTESKITGYEMITSIYGIGALDTFDVDLKNIINIFKKKIKKSFKYFFYSELKGIPILISYNPMVKYKDLVNFIVNEDLKFKCNFIQIGNVSLKRNLDIIQSQEEGNCKIITYKIE